jgi:hypothetical protein
MSVSRGRWRTSGYMKYLDHVNYGVQGGGSFCLNFEMRFGNLIAQYSIMSELKTNSKLEHEMMNATVIKNAQIRSSFIENVVGLFIYLKRNLDLAFIKFSFYLFK